jgi:hypothetical protein
MQHQGSTVPPRDSGRRAFLRALTALPFSTRALGGSGRAQSADMFQLGWNHPWIGYGHDFGRAWGHDGLSTNGWTCETGKEAQGFTDSEVTTDHVSGRGALRIAADLAGQHPNRSSGAVHVSLVDHWPFACPPPEAATSVDLDGAIARLRIRLPKGSAGSMAAPNGLQLFLKTRVSAQHWPSLYTRWVQIAPSWEERDVEIAVRLDSRDAAQSDPDFDITRVSLIGLKMAINSGSSSAVTGVIWLDEFVLETDPPLAFDFEQTELDAEFTEVRGPAGRALSLVRFFIFCDGRAAPSFAPDGSVTGIDDSFYRDFDALLRVAARHGVFLMPVLLDFGWCAHARTVSGVRLGGHANVIRDAAKRQTFLENALEPLIERYGKHPAIFAWDICNEPEWIIDGIPSGLRQDLEVVTLDEMRGFVQSCAEYVHRLSPTHLVTLGSARRMWLALWSGLHLDLYQFHWYDKFHREEPFPWRPYDELGLDKPCMIGEVPTANTRITRQQFITAAQEGGYSGLLFWSYGARDPFSNLCWTQRRRDISPPATGGPKLPRIVTPKP